ncbi:uncharacterized protein N7482_005555 [Penicillium canariense]|uniref:Uncharacterized protein n=1 Tax=Penicillium canariense TaxID=189055 RepID=A0A9W9I514_9EURO|nr:uncharacterized protein N7482_005555 [Penicillium canariense]KAJ5166774.1 hypothetical protein N7482_005555 [Penicillium canariense]
MSSTPIQKFTLISSFAANIIYLSNKHETPSPNATQAAWDPKAPRQPDVEPNFVFGDQNGLLNLMERVFSLHVLAQETGGLDSKSITQALTVWNDLEHLRPPEPLDTPRYLSLHAACVSALFVWLYLVVHPEDIGDEKVQTTVHTGLVNAENVSDSETFPFLLIPAFCLGLASIRDEERECVKGIFDKAERSGISKRFRETVTKSWKRQDRGMKRSWDWSI